MTISLTERYARIRQHSQALIAPLSPEDCSVQSMPDASPSKWHLAHTSWFFETVLLIPLLPDYRAFNPQFGYLFNSYYDSFGDRHARPQRGLLTRPGLSEVLDYRAHIDAAMTRLLADDDPEVARLCEIGLHHEQQHQELLLTDIQHAFFCNPLYPAYSPAPPAPLAATTDTSWLRLEPGLVTIGHDGPGFAYDNEGPAHPTYLHGAELSHRLVNNAEWQAFIADGGYERPELWLSDGWDWRQREALSAPLYWQQRDGAWWEFGLGGFRPLAPTAPVAHLSFYEADAYARWAGARLPSEAEWEAAADETGDWFGEVWQWTMSPYSPYPGYRPPAGALAEYNAKFMCNQLVLRGSSRYTPAGHARRSYRNFFYPQTRWQRAGLRLARDLT